MSTQAHFELWPVPSAPPPLSPSRLAGSTPESTKKVLEFLKLNHEKWDIFYDGSGRHNHISHHLLALWALGADSEIIQAGYDLHSQLQREQNRAAYLNDVITRDNVFNHLGQRNYYPAYVAFFAEEVENKGGVAVLEEFVFSHDANYPDTGKHPEMLSRFLTGLFHPIIHVGYGAEFGLPGMFVEGLAQIAVNTASNTSLVPPLLFVESSGGTEPTHAFMILTKIQENPAFDVEYKGFMTIFQDARTACASASVEYAKEWLPDMQPSPELIRQKIEELEWMVAVMYSVPGFSKGAFNAEFIAMHLVTSSLFVQSLTPSLHPRSQTIFLRSYFTLCLVTWGILGRPHLDIEGFFAADIARINERSQANLPSPSKFVFPSPSSPLSTNPNPWLHILQQSIVHPDDHVVKLQRALYHYASKYESTPGGYFNHTGLPGADKLDGTLFVRAASLTMKKLAREVEQLPERFTFWDRRTFRPEGQQEEGLY